MDACSEYITLGDWAKALSHAIGKPVKTLHLPKSIFDDYSHLLQGGVPEAIILMYKACYEK